jgi:hypothetical protein
MVPDYLFLSGSTKNGSYARFTLKSLFFWRGGGKLCPAQGFSTDVTDSSELLGYPRTTKKPIISSIECGNELWKNLDALKAPEDGWGDQPTNVDEYKEFWKNKVLPVLKTKPTVRTFVHTVLTTKKQQCKAKDIVSFFFM